MPLWAWPFFLIGAAAAFGAVMIVGVELTRAAQQGLRIAYVVNRIDGKRGFGFKAWAAAFRYELTAQYDVLTIGWFRIDRRLSTPIKRAA